MKHSFRLLFALLLCMAFATVCLAAPSAVTDFDTASENSAYKTVENPVLSADAEGDGTISSPYIITTAEEFNSFAALVNGNNSSYGTAYYVLENNIDFTGKKLVPFGVETASFKGHFDGNGYGIFGVDIQDVRYFGVIGYMTQGSVKNLSVSYNSANSQFYALEAFGGIVGYANADTANSIVISDCDTSGNIKINSSNPYHENGLYAGGVVARVYASRANVVVTDSVSYCNFDVNFKDSSTVGGFAGYTRAASSMYFSFKNCVAYGEISLVTSGGRNQCGGFVGYSYKDEPGWVEANLSEMIYHFDNCMSYGGVYTKCGRTARVGGFGGKVDSTYVTLSGNYKNADKTVVGEAMFLELDESGTAVSTIKDKSFIEETMGYNLERDWYLSSTDKMLYLRATAKKNDAARLNEGVSIRLSDDNRNGLRFTADIDMFKRDYVTEYGYIISTEKKLGTNELTFDFAGEYVSGAAYDANTDIFFDKTDNIVTFAGVLYNIPKTGYEQKIVARTYINYSCDGVTYTLYGNTVKASIGEIAAALKSDSASFDKLSDVQKQVFAEMFPEL